MWEEKLAIYDRIVEACQGFERKGKNMVYTSANGYMFSQLNKAAEIGIRLPKEAAAKFIAQHPGSGPFLSYGAVMRDYVLVPDDLLKDDQAMVAYLEESFAYVSSLPPNPGKKK